MVSSSAMQFCRVTLFLLISMLLQNKNGVHSWSFLAHNALVRNFAQLNALSMVCDATVTGRALAQEVAPHHQVVTVIDDESFLSVGRGGDKTGFSVSNKHKLR